MLDLFAGTGALAIEALSRGAETAVLVDRSERVLNVVRANLASLDLGIRARVICGDAAKTARRLEGPDRFDLVFLDPPYKVVGEDPTRCAYRCQQLLARMAPGGVICFHFLDGNLDRDDFDTSLNVEIRRWGKSAVALLEVPGQAGGEGPELGEGMVTDTAYEAGDPA